jgi:capsular polysaccharide export protein
MPVATLHALGFSRWKRRALRLCFAGRELRFVGAASEVPDGAELAVWGMHEVPAAAAARGVRVLRVEDGFLRSVGLGADLTQPVSWVVDRRGLYFDAARPSDLEVLLATADFPADLLERAAALRRCIVEASLTKYNVGAAVWRRPPQAARVILVPGQVESDASIRHGAPGVASNLALLQAVRAAHPDAHLVYKPHPDVVAGLRRPGVGEGQAQALADETVVDAPMGELLREVDEVHCLTSLAGFEALLRGKPVTCHGQPFYAGWGLTTDVHPVARRQRRLQLDELVAAALILYPTYMSPAQRRRVTPEQAVAELVAWRARSAGALPWWRRALRVALRRMGGAR